MKPILSVLALTLLLFPASTSFGQTGGQEAEIHVPVPTGWEAVDQEYRYGPNNLWEYINGAADLFLTYRFRELTVADFEKGDMGLTVSVYDMSLPIYAFGVYDTEKPADLANLEGIGSAAVLQPPYRGLLLKDRFYVKVEVGGGDITREVLQKAMEDIAKGLPGSNELPSELAALPVADRVPGSVSFSGANFLGLSDLSNCLFADYKLEDGTEYRLFVMTPKPSFLSNKDGRWTKESLAEGLLFYREIPYSGAVVLRGDDKMLIGVSGFEDVGQASKLLESL